MINQYLGLPNTTLVVVNAAQAIVGKIYVSGDSCRIEFYEPAGVTKTIDLNGATGAVVVQQLTSGGYLNSGGELVIDDDRNLYTELVNMVSGAFTGQMIVAALTANHTYTFPDKSIIVAGLTDITDAIAANGLGGVLAVSNDAAGTIITGLPTPSGSSDAAPKSYVDAQVAAAGTLQAVTTGTDANKTTNDIDVTNGVSATKVGNITAGYYMEFDPNNVVVSIYGNGIRVGQYDGAGGGFAFFDASGNQTTLIPSNGGAFYLNMPPENGMLASREWVIAQGYSTVTYTDADAKTYIEGGDLAQLMLNTATEPSAPAADKVIIWFDGTNLNYKTSDGTVITF